MSKFVENANNCKHCGGKDIRVYKTVSKKQDDEWWNIFCHDCTAELKYFNTIEEAVKAWNEGFKNGR